MSAQEAPVGYTNGTSFKWNTRGQVIAAATVLPALGLIEVTLRFWSRLHQKRSGAFGLDDAFMFPALLCVIGLGVTILYGVAKEVLAHTTPPDPNAGNPEAQLYQTTPQQVLAEKILFTIFTLTVVAYGCVKLSVIFFYRRIFVKGTNSKFDIATKVAIGISLAWTITFFFLQIFLCGRHIDWNWGPFIDLTHCVDGFKYDNALFISDLITDVVAICLPIPIILRLHMTLKRKLAIIGVLLLGTMSIVASVIRIVFGLQTQAAGLALPTDVNESLTTLAYWIMLEAGISLIATNLPSMYFIIKKESLQSFASSIRSRISLGSLRSQRSNSGAEDESSCSKQRNGSTASHVPVAGRDLEHGKGPGGATSFAMYDMKHTVGSKKPGVVQAAGDIMQQGNMV